MSDKRWNSRFTFILAAVGSAVGLGNCWRFPGLCAKHGGGAFLLVYVIAMIALGVPMLCMEIAIGRHMRGGAPKSLKGINKHGEKVGWSAIFNGFVICCYYTIVFAWVIAMIVASVNFGSMTGTPDAVEAARNFFLNDVIQATGDTSLLGAGGNIPLGILLAAVAAWGLVYYCIRDGATSVGKVVKYTVFVPVILLAILAVKGLIGNPHLGEAFGKLFVPDWSQMQDPMLWVDAIGQVFYSLSIMMAIIFAYGSYLDEKANIAVDGMIISFADLFVSVLSSIVLFTTMYGSGYTIADISDSGISTAFVIYPMALVQFTPFGWLNSVFAMIFYLTLATLAIDSAFSIAEGVSRAFCDKFALDQNKTTRNLVLIMAAISIIFITGAGLGWLDIVDHWTNMINLILIGAAECIFVGWFFKPSKVWDEVNKNTQKFKMPKWWFIGAIKFVAPAVLMAFCGWNIVSMFMNGANPAGGFYGSYGLYAEIIGGWLITAIVLGAGFIMKFIISRSKRLQKRVEIAELSEKTWDEMSEIQDEIRASAASVD